MRKRNEGVMAFRSDRQVSARVYRYGALPPSTNAGLVDEQMRLAHRYQNRLIEIERDRRDRYNEILGTVPAVAVARTTAEALAVHLATAEKHLRDLRSTTRKRNPDAELTAKIRGTRTALSEARKAQREAEAQARETMAEQIQESDAAALRDLKQARAECGVYWGTYLIVERSIPRSGRPPRFRRWDGSGQVAVQLQGGLTEAELLGGGDQRLRLRLGDDWGPRGKRSRGILQIRVGSEGRSPVWADVPIVYHRRIPEGARIKWAQLVRRRVGTRYVWSLCLTVETAGAAMEVERPKTPFSAGVPALAIDLGWRSTVRGIRVAYATDGERSAEILVPPWVADGYRLVHDLRSIRDQSLDTIRPQLADWLREHDHPEWLRERCTHLHQWRSSQRLASLVLHWGRERFGGDGEIYAALESWRRQDAHLYQWERDAERYLLHFRRNLYRHWADWIAKHYGCVVLESTNLAEQLRKPKAGEEKEQVVGAHAQASPGELRRQIVETCQREGVRVVLVPSKHTTRRCAACGELGITRTASLHVTCDHCQAVVDQDCNAARQILGFASGGVVSPSAPPLEEPNESWYQQMMREPVRVRQRRERLEASRSQNAT